MQSGNITPTVIGLSPEIPESVGCHLGISDGVLNVFVAEIVLQGSGVVAVIG
jgi:hypothetical protein